MKIRIALLCIFLVLCFIGNNTLMAQVQKRSASDPKLVDIRKLMTLDGSVELAFIMVNTYYKNMQAKYPQTPATFWEGAQETMSPFHLLERLTAIYDKYLTHAEIKSLIQFYQTPLGKKLVQMSPKINAESMQITNLWGYQVSQILERKLKEAKK